MTLVIMAHKNGMQPTRRKPRAADAGLRPRIERYSQV
jgi:hypothetical protein